MKKIKLLREENQETKLLVLALLDAIHKMENKYHKGFAHECPF